MAPVAVDLCKMRRDKKNKEGRDACEEPAPVMEEGRDERINQMSAAYKRLSAVAGTLTDGAEELKNLAPDVDLLKDYISSGQWLQDKFAADPDLELKLQD